MVSAKSLSNATAFDALTTEQVTSITRASNYGTWRIQKTWKPMHVVDAEGCYFIDAAGKRYLDFSSQLMCVNLGHKNPRVIESIAEQARELPYIMPGFATTSRARLSQKLLELLPAGLEKFFFATSGTEANEAAFKIARMYTGKTKIISRYRSYHGSTTSSISSTGDPRRWAMEPSGKAPGHIFAPETNCYKCPIKHTYPQCGIACADYIEHMIANESDVAAIIVEPIVGTNGVLVPPPEYMPKLKAICEKYGVLFIADEVMTGWGRTGKWFCVDHWGVKPDILVTAKGITSAYVPLGLCATTTAIAEYFEDHYFSHGHTYEAHPLTLGPAVATIEEMQRLKLVERAAETLEAVLPEILGDRAEQLRFQERWQPAEDETEASRVGIWSDGEIVAPPAAPILLAADGWRLLEQCLDPGHTVAKALRQDQRSRKRRAGQELRSRNLHHPAFAHPAADDRERRAQLAGIDDDVDRLRRDLLE